MTLFTLNSLVDLNRFAQALAGVVRGGQTIGLIGDLGAGKTTLTRSLVAALGSTDQVSSPSFVLEHRYRVPNGVEIEHWDLYRLEATPPELFEPVGPNTVRLIEWAERLGQSHPLNLRVELTFGEQPEQRRVHVVGELVGELTRNSYVKANS